MAFTLNREVISVSVVISFLTSNPILDFSEFVSKIIPSPPVRDVFEKTLNIGDSKL